ncbi:hypothetical protein GGI00_006494, partial [Coemansia sp. RSA 2681]
MGMEEERSAVATPTPRKRGRPPSAQASSKRGAWPGTPTRGRGRGRGRGGGAGRMAAAAAARAPGSDGSESPGGGADAAAQSSEDEEYEPAEAEGEGPASLLGVRRGVQTPAPLQVVPAAAGRRRGRPRKSVGVAGSSAGRGVRDLETLVGGMALATPVRRGGWEVRRLPVHLSKHDAFRSDQLDDALRIMQAVPVDGDDRYEMKKMADAVRMCGYEEQQRASSSSSFSSFSHALDDVYRLLAWAVHGATGAAEQPEIGEEAKALVLRVFADIGRRIRVETVDLAAYHRRHVLRKLLLAEAAGPATATAAAAEPHAAEETMEEVGSPRSEHAVHRRNPLRVPGPL